LRPQYLIPRPLALQPAAYAPGDPPASAGHRLATCPRASPAVAVTAMPCRLHGPGNERFQIERDTDRKKITVQNASGACETSTSSRMSLARNRVVCFSATSIAAWACVWDAGANNSSDGKPTFAFRR